MCVSQIECRYICCSTDKSSHDLGTDEWFTIFAVDLYQVEARNVMTNDSRRLHKIHVAHAC